MINEIVLVRLNSRNTHSRNRNPKCDCVLRYAVLFGVSQCECNTFCHAGDDDQKVSISKGIGSKSNTQEGEVVMIAATGVGTLRFQGAAPSSSI